MTSPGLELQKAVFAALKGDAGLVGAIGAPRIYDHAPANVPFPYITFGRTAVYDWSTGDEIGTEHLFTLHFWSKAKGRAEALSLMQIAKDRLHDATLALEGHSLVNLRCEFEEVRYNEDLSVYYGIVRFRAVLEAVE